jgi:hypothetical protein
LAICGQQACLAFVIATIKDRGAQTEPLSAAAQ